MSLKKKDWVTLEAEKIERERKEGEKTKKGSYMMIKGGVTLILGT